MPVSVLQPERSQKRARNRSGDERSGGKTASKVTGLALKNTELVSVVIPCYNQARFLCEAIESVLRQSYRCFEVIVVDDGSADAIGDVVSRYRGINCIRQPNQGPAAARNAGLRSSKGSYLVFLDADDRLLPEALAIGVRDLKARPECAFVWGQCQHIDREGDSLPSRWKPVIEHDHYLALLRTNYIRTPGVVMYRRTVFDAIGGFNPDLRGAEDYNLHLRIAREFPIHCHNQVVAEYRVHEASAMHSSARIFKATLAAAKLQWEFVKGDELREAAYHSGMKAWRQLFGERLWVELGAHLRRPRTNWKPAMQCLWTLLRFDPEGLALRSCARLYGAAAKTKSYEAVGSDPRSQ
jgi:glycosyltransferase involved in cell wall biosynthesis